jgi:hypothetical protein
MANEQEKDDQYAEPHENDNKAAKQPSISDILRSGGFRTVSTIANVRQRRRYDPESDIGSVDA